MAEVVVEPVDASQWAEASHLDKIALEQHLAVHDSRLDSVAGEHWNHLEGVALLVCEDRLKEAVVEDGKIFLV